MYSEELEMLIDAALMDGELTEKEKQILFKKAQNFGIDLDEFNMVIEGRLQKIQANAKPKESNKRGSVKRCPNCGAVVTDFSVTKCPECGYVFDDIEVNSSLQKLTDQIVKIQEKHSQNITRQISLGNNSIFSTSEQKEMRMYELRDKEIASCILTFPVSKSKADLLEFISGSMSQLQVADSGIVKNAWRGKWKECISKAQMFYPNDTDFAPLVQQWQSTQTFWNSVLVFWQGLSKNTKTIVMLLPIIVFFFSIPWIISLGSSSYNEGVIAEQKKLDAIYNQCVEYIKQDNLLEAETTANKMVWTFTSSYSNDYKEIQEQYEKMRENLLEQIEELKNKNSKKKGKR